MKRTYNKSKQVIKFTCSWTFSKIVEFVNRQLQKGAKLVKDYTSKGNMISFTLEYC